jgi:glycosyltransferase involved in cell wall biosynthesis
MDNQLTSDDSPKQLRLLFILPFTPCTDAIQGGSRATGQLLARIAPHHKIALLYFRNPEDAPLQEEIRKNCEMVEEVIRPWAKSGGLSSWIRNARLIASLLFLFRPMWVTDWASANFRKRARQLIQTWPVDIVQLEFHVMGQYLPELKESKAPKILTIHEPGSRAAPYLKRLNPWINGVVDAFDKFAWRRYEKLILRDLQSLVVFTEGDRDAYLDLRINTPIRTIPLGTVVPETPLDPIGKSPLNILFFGNFLHPPNIEAANRLLLSIFPRVKEHYPDLVLFVVGDHPPIELEKAADANVFITGRVPDLTPYLDRAALVVAPMHSGGGMRLKVLEALAAGKAVVATPLAVEGLAIEDGQQVALALNDDDFADKVIHLLNSPEERSKLAIQAHSWAKDHIGWEYSVNSYEQLYHTLLKKPGD